MNLIHYQLFTNYYYPNSSDPMLEKKKKTFSQSVPVAPQSNDPKILLTNQMTLINDLI